jgi:hypothetical protein
MVGPGVPVLAALVEAAVAVLRRDEVLEHHLLQHFF